MATGGSATTSKSEPTSAVAEGEKQIVVTVIKPHRVIHPKAGAADNLLHSGQRPPFREESSGSAGTDDDDRFTRSDHGVCREDLSRRRRKRLTAIDPLPTADVLRHRADVRQLPEITARGVRIDLGQKKIGCLDFEGSQSHATEGGVGGRGGQQGRRRGDRCVVTSRVNHAHDLATAGRRNPTVAGGEEGNCASRDGSRETTVGI